MAKITLKEELENKGILGSNILVSSILVPTMEVYGYLNSSFETFTGSSSLYGLINKNPINEIVCSNYLYQPTSYLDGKGELVTQGLAAPIFNSLSVCQENEELDLEELYIPSLLGNGTYKVIKSRRSSKIDNYTIRKAQFPESIFIKEGKAIYAVKQGDIICRDKDGEIKSIGEEIVVLCRYIHHETGAMRYTQLSLNELFIEK